MKKFLPLVIAAIFTTQIFAVDYGAILSTNTDFKFDKNEYSYAMLEQSETLRPFIKAPFNETTYIAAELSLTHKLNDILGIDFDADNNFIADLSLLKFNKIVKFQNASSLEISLGRMITSDLTGNIFAQTNDGFMLKYNSQSVIVGAYCGYSGLLNVKNVDILCSSGEKFFVDDENKIYDFAAPYLIASISVSAPYLFAKQTLSFEALGVFAVGGPSELPDDEEHRIYATLSLNGPMIPTLFYNASLTFETNNFSQAALFAKFAMVYYAPIKDITLTVSALYASGENGGLSPFVGLTKQKACLSADEPNYSGILKMGLAFTILPVKQLYLSLGTDVVFDVMDGGEYYGFQAALGAQWQVFSDLKFAFGASTFVGKEEANNRTDFVISAAIAF